MPGSTPTNDLIYRGWMPHPGNPLSGFIGGYGGYHDARLTDFLGAPS
jgi:hypothetical protein